MPRSHKHGLTVSITPKRGLHVYFQKRASGFNQCIGDKLRHGKYADREAVRAGFKSAVAACRKPEQKAEERTKIFPLLPP